MDDALKIVNRHKARLLHKLEEAGCPVVFLDAVKKELWFLKKDIMSLGEEE